LRDLTDGKSVSPRKKRNKRTRGVDKALTAACQTSEIVDLLFLPSSPLLDNSPRQSEPAFKTPTRPGIRARSASLDARPHDHMKPTKKQQKLLTDFVKAGPSQPRNTAPSNADSLQPPTETDDSTT